MAILARLPRLSTVDYSAVSNLDGKKKPLDQMVLNIQTYSFKGVLYLGRVLILIQNCEFRLRY